MMGGRGRMCKKTKAPSGFKGFLDVDCTLQGQECLWCSEVSAVLVARFSRPEVMGTSRRNPGNSLTRP